jgi:hypothetical protein
MECLNRHPENIGEAEDVLSVALKKTQKEKDLIKKTFAIKNNIDFIEIPSWKILDIENILQNKIISHRRQTNGKI